jgi:hypothetical protein
MPFSINTDLLAQARVVLSNRKRLFWIVGGAGSGKTTVCSILSEQHVLPVYDMDAHIYGTYHNRFSPDRHPVNTTWSTSENGLAWLLSMSWDEFNNFNQAALPEYLDLLAEDLADTPPDSPLLIDGGITNPALLAKVLPLRQLVCLAAKPGINVWERSDRQEMKTAIFQLPNPEEAWRKFLEFDNQITRTIEEECLENQIKICRSRSSASVEDLAADVARLLGL